MSDMIIEAAKRATQRLFTQNGQNNSTSAKGVAKAINSVLYQR